MYNDLVKKMPKIKVCAFIVAITLLFNVPAKAAVTPPLILNPNAAREKAIIDQLVELKSKSTVLKKSLEELDSRLNNIDLKIQNVQDDITETEIYLSKQTTILNKRAASIYKEGTKLGPLRIILSAENISDMVARVDLFDRIIRRDADVISEIKEKKERLDLLRASFYADRQQIVILKEQKERKFTNYIQIKERLKKKLALATQEDIQRTNQWMVLVTRIQKLLIRRNSPMAPFSAEFVLAGKKYGINPKLIVAISGIESSFGQKLAGPYNAWGRKAKGGGYKSYSSWKEAIWDQAAYLKRVYIDKGLITVEQIAPKYCPPNYKVWTAKVKLFMSLI